MPLADLPSTFSAPGPPDRARSRSTAVLLATVLVALVGASTACADERFEDRTARVTVDGRTSTFQLDSCGRDGETVFVVGRTDNGDILQAVVGVSPDGEGALPAATGVTVDTIDAVDIVAGQGAMRGAFGAESWRRRGESGPAPGTIDSAQVRGARIQVSGEAVALDAAGRMVTDVVPVDFELDARCDAGAA